MNLIRKTRENLKIFDQSIFLSSEKLDDLNSEDYKKSLELILNATRENGIDKLMEQYNVDFLMAPSAAPTFLIDHMYGDYLSLEEQVQDGYQQLQVTLI